MIIIRRNIIEETIVDRRILSCCIKDAFWTSHIQNLFPFPVENLTRPHVMYLMHCDDWMTRNIKKDGFQVTKLHEKNIVKRRFCFVFKN